MSKYTTEVRFICENYANYDESQGYKKVNEIIAEARAKVFDFSYPIFDENYRATLETKILKHFYTREIGAESVGLWKMWLDTRLNEVMPFFNKRYESELIEFNPLADTELTTDHRNDGTGTSVNNGKENEATSNRSKTDSNEDTRNKGKNSGWNLYSDTPQGGVEGLESNKYLTNATKETGDSENEGNTAYSGASEGTSDRERTTNGTVSFTNTEDYLEHIVGKRGVGSYSKMLMEFRDTFLNIDMEVIHSLDDLFMNLW